MPERRMSWTASGGPNGVVFAASDGGLILTALIRNQYVVPLTRPEVIAAVSVALTQPDNEKDTPSVETSAT